MKKNDRLFTVIFRRFALASGLMLIILLRFVSAPPLIHAQENAEAGLQFSVSLSEEEIVPGTEVDLILEATNTRNTPVENFTFHLFLTGGFDLVADKDSGRYIYDPVLSKTITVPPQSSTTILVQIFVSEDAGAVESIALVKAFEDEAELDDLLLRRDISIIGGDISQQVVSAIADYTMPILPNISCGPAPGLSYIGNAVYQEIENTHYSRYSWCNEFIDDWILDVPNVIATTPETSAEDFYTMIAALIERTNYVFSMSTLWFNTHNQTISDRNLVRFYLAPAILNLHQNTPAEGPYPLVRFIYSPSTGLDYSDPIEKVYEDLTAAIKTIEPDSKNWRVSIAIAEIGNIPTSPWNHSKIAVSDYEYAIVGGMNWELNYTVSVDVDGDGTPDDTVEYDNRVYLVERLYDLSVQVRGATAKDAGEYFDLLWRRNIDPWPFDPHGGNDCKNSWELIDENWDHDCPLEGVPNYSPTGDRNIPPFDVEKKSTVFGIGRGHTEWSTVNDMDDSADRAIFAAIKFAKDSIYISQHQLSQPSVGGLNVVEKVISHTLEAIVDNRVRIKIAMSEPWGSGSGLSPEPDSVTEIYNYLDKRLSDYANETFQGDQQKVHEALCRLEFAPFRVPKYPVPDSLAHIFYTHNKFIMIDDISFYVGSQNLYPSGIDDGTGPELNEYGYLIDDPTLAQQIKQEYWDPIWMQIESENFVFRSSHLPIGFDCSTNMYQTFLPAIIKGSQLLVTNID